MARKETSPTIIINRVVADSIAADLNIDNGDRLIEINGQIPRDSLDYHYLLAGEFVSLYIRKASGEEFIYEIEKDYDEDLGIELIWDPLTEIRCCQNHCIFCFVDQMPKGMRPSLYIKDDDYRLSFLKGNFVTLTNLSTEELDRIINLRLSPLYISIHTVDPALRQRLMGNKKAGEIRKQLDTLAAAGIQFHAQIVLIPGFNNGFYLEETISTIAKYWPQARSLAIVPVGLTGHRQGLTDLRPFTPQEASNVVRWGTGWQELLRQKLGITFVHLADEFYVLAQQEVPEREKYEGFPQLENGVGFLRLFLDELEQVALPSVISPPQTITIITGMSAAAAIKKLCQRLHEVKGLTIRLEVIRNHHFGETVTVAGLITGSDLLKQLEGKVLGDVVFIPDVMLREGTDRFLDDYSLEDLITNLGTTLEVVSGPKDIANWVWNHEGMG
jgi:putative radical SAM enzyme (TIGR03279 family)